MPKVHFEPSNVECDAELNEELIDVTDNFPDADVPYSCRSASCGACRVEVLEGMDGLNPVGDEEQDVLDMFGDGKEVRLCCQLKIVKEVPAIRLRVLEPC